MLFGWVFGFWWGVALSVNLATVVMGLWPRRPLRPADTLPAVSVMVPVKGAGPPITPNLEALFNQDYPLFEVVFAVADEDDPAIPLLQRLIAAHGNVPARLTTDPTPGSGNPKLDNLRRAWRLAKHELILLCDVNARFRPDELRRLVAQLVPGIGLLSVVPVATEPEGFCGELEAAFFNTGGARWLMAAARLGFGGGVGQTMLLRRGDLERIGGFDAMAAAGACEDAVLGEAIRRAGLGVRMARDPGWHPIGSRRFSDFWQRQLRWMCCRKYHALPVFVLEPSGSPLATAIAGGIWWGWFAGLPVLPLIAGQLAVWFAIEGIYARAQGWHLSWLSPVAWLVREAMIPALWLRAVIARSLIWRGQRIVLPPVLAVRRQR
ncbi:MAG TPA: glycosyltransferase [Stellaceae bacterium]|nr:glycosyltransferase [Stellaceae bacterium]